VRRCDIETSNMRRALARDGPQRHKKKTVVITANLMFIPYRTQLHVESDLCVGLFGAIKYFVRALLR